MSNSIKFKVCYNEPIVCLKPNNFFLLFQAEVTKNNLIHSRINFYFSFSKSGDIEFNEEETFQKNKIRKMGFTSEDISFIYKKIKEKHLKEISKEIYLIFDLYRNSQKIFDVDNYNFVARRNMLKKQYEYTVEVEDKYLVNFVISSGDKSNEFRFNFIIVNSQISKRISVRESVFCTKDLLKYDKIRLKYLLREEMFK